MVTPVLGLHNEAASVGGDCSAGFGDGNIHSLRTRLRPPVDLSGHSDGNNFWSLPALVEMETILRQAPYYIANPRVLKTFLTSWKWDILTAGFLTEPWIYSHIPKIGTVMKAILTQKVSPGWNRCYPFYLWGLPDTLFFASSFHCLTRLVTLTSEDSEGIHGGWILLLELCV